MGTDGAMQTLVRERQRLIGRLEQESEQLETLQQVVETLSGQIKRDQDLLRQIDSALGKAPQMELEHANLRLRGRALEEIAVELLRRKRGGDEVHYRDWFELLRTEGHLVAGKNPLDNFLAQINRSEAIVS